MQSVLVYKLTEQDKALNLDEDYLSKQHRAPTQGVIGKAKCVKRCTKDQRHYCTVSLPPLLSQERKHHVTQKGTKPYTEQNKVDTKMTKIVTFNGCLHSRAGDGGCAGDEGSAARRASPRSLRLKCTHRLRLNSLHK